MFYRINVYVATKEGDKLLQKGAEKYTEITAVRLTNLKNKALGHKDPYNILAPVGTKFAMYEEA